MKHYLIILVLFLFSSLSFAQRSPISSSIKTTSYTVPVGKYAEVLDLAGDLSVDSVSTALSFTRSFAIPNTTPTAVDLGSMGPYGAYVQFQSSASFGYLVNVTRGGTIVYTVNGQAAFNETVFIPPSSNETWQMVSNGQARTINVTVKFVKDPYPVSVKGGTVLTGSRYLVNLFER